MASFRPRLLRIIGFYQAFDIDPPLFCMHTLMFGSTHYHQIVNTIIRLFTIDVVNNLILVEKTIKVFLHHQSMLENISARICVRMIGAAYLNITVGVPPRTTLPVPVIRTSHVPFHALIPWLSTRLKMVSFFWVLFKPCPVTQFATKSLVSLKQLFATRFTKPVFFSREPALPTAKTFLIPLKGRSASLAKPTGWLSGLIVTLVATKSFKTFFFWSPAHLACAQFISSFVYGFLLYTKKVKGETYAGI